MNPTSTISIEIISVIIIAIIILTGNAKKEKIELVLILIGAFSNLAVQTANGGYMPVFDKKLLSYQNNYKIWNIPEIITKKYPPNTKIGSHILNPTNAKLSVLGDWISLSMGNFVIDISIGDVFVTAGLGMLILKRIKKLLE